MVNKYQAKVNLLIEQMRMLIAKKKMIIIFVTFLFLSFSGFTQNSLQKKITINAKNQSLKNVLNDITAQSDLLFSYNNQLIDENQKITIVARNQPAINIVKQLSIELNLEYSIIEKQIILKPKQTVNQINNNTNTANINSTTQTFTISGYVKDSSNNEVLIGATVVIKNNHIATSTNGYGFYSISVPKGNYIIEFSFLGYEKKSIEIYVDENKNISQFLNLNIQELNIITVSNNQLNPLLNSDLKRYKLNSKDVLNQPMFGGEHDAIQSLKAVSGVIIGEGSVMFNVRGGDKGQNAIYIDEAPIYNPSHLLGLFSAIAPDAINSMTVYKSAFPVQYGNRLSSLIDVKTKDGNMKKIGFGAIFSPILSTFSIDGPIKKEKSSFILTLRRSNINYLFAKTAPNLQINFRDFHVKYNKRFNRKNRIYFAYYSGYDNLKISESAIKWQNKTFTFRWNHLFSDKIFSNITFLTSSYKYYFYYSVPKNIFWSSNISTVSFKNDYSYYLQSNNKVNFGFETKIQSYNPGNLTFGNFYFEQVFAGNVLQNVLYLGGEYKIDDDFLFNYGLRVNNWNNFGPTQSYDFNINHQLVDTLYFDNKIFNSYNPLEFRTSVLWFISHSTSFSLSYDHNVQFLHFISNSISPFTTLDVWLPASLNIKPQTANQFTLGYNLQLAEIQIIAETYYKKMNNQTDYSNQPDLFLNPYFENQLRFGTSNSAGFEISAEKQTGSFRFKINYSYSKTIRITPEVNNNKPYPPLWDKPHNFYFNILWQVSKRTNLSMSFFFISGSRFSSPTGFYNFQNYTIPIYENKNNDKLPDYHKLDLSLRTRLNKNEHNRYEHFLTISINNLYGRQNVFAVNFNKIETPNGNFLVPTNFVSQRDLISTSMSLFGFIPSVSYQFKFR